MEPQKNEQEFRTAVLLARSRITDDMIRKAAGQLYKRCQLCLEQREAGLNTCSRDGVKERWAGDYFVNIMFGVTLVDVLGILSGFLFKSETALRGALRFRISLSSVPIKPPQFPAR